MLKLVSIAAAALAVLLAGGHAHPAQATGEKAVAEMKTRDGKDLGKIKLIETTAGVLIRVALKGLPPGPHGFHVHETGKCEGADFKSAGAIYNPLGAKHGFLNEEGPMAGDLPNLNIAANGEVTVDLIAAFLTLSKDAEESLMDADGTALIIHEAPDDYKTEPEGGSGARIACGVIAVTK